jgi:hypothetical protein
MAWSVAFTFFIWAMAVGLLLPGAVLRCIPVAAAAGCLVLRTGRAVAIIAALSAPVVNFLMMQLAR